MNSINGYLLSPIKIQEDTTPMPKPLDKYSFENLRNNSQRG